jgi:hypothetical protein
VRLRIKAHSSCLLGVGGIVLIFIACKFLL